MIEISINPIALTIGGLEIRWYGVFILLAILTVLFWATREVRKQSRLNLDQVFTAGIVAIPSGIVGSRLLHVIDQWSYYSQFPGEFVGGAGLTIYGAVLGASLGLFIYGKIARFPTGYFLDLLVSGILLAQFIGRIGCTINGCCYGVETQLPWSITYTHPDSYGPPGVATHPTTVYEMLFLLAAFPALLWLRGRLRPEGSVFLVYLSLYSLWRFVSDFLRKGTEFAFGLHEAQFVAMVIMAICISILAYRTRWVSKQTVPEESTT